MDRRHAILVEEWWSRALSQVLGAFRDAMHKVKVRRRERSLRLRETLPLGEHRFLMVIEFERRRFLIGSTNQSISLIERLDEDSNPSNAVSDPRWADSLWKRPH